MPKISELTNITGANLADDDEFVVVDTDAGVTKAVTRAEFFKDTPSIGIGTSSPGRTLDIQTASGDADARIYAQGTTSSDDAVLYLGIAGTTATTRINFGDSGDADAGRIIYDHSGDFMSFTTAASEAMRIDSSGRVGIGTSSPSADLEVIGGDTEAVSIKSDGHIQLYDSGNATRSYTFLSRNLGHSMVGGNIRLDVGVTTGSHIGYSNGTDSRGGSGIVFENTSLGSSDYGEIYFIQSNDTNDDTWVVREAMRIDSSGNVGIGNASPTEKLDVTGNVTISGSISKGSGSFRIDHPLKPDTHHLVHSFIEGPQADNLYRGKVVLVAGQATVNLDEAGRMSEGTFAALNGNVQCFTTNEDGWTAVRGSVSGNILTIEAQDATCTDTVSWLVIGERHDQHMLDTTWTDEAGRIIVEPEKVVVEDAPE